MHLGLHSSTLLFLISSLDTCAAFRIGEVKRFVGIASFQEFRTPLKCACSVLVPLHLRPYLPTFHIGCTNEKFCVDDSMKSMKDEVEIKLLDSVQGVRSAGG